MRLNIIVEGKSESKFVSADNGLGNYLANKGIYVSARVVYTSKKKKCKGGISNYSKPKNDILNWLKQEKAQNIKFSTMFDYYQLPSDFPGYTESRKFTNIYDRINFLEEKFKEDINDSRFIPYIQLHEFESMLFTKIIELNKFYPNHSKPISALLSETENIAPEQINDNIDTAPSKRIIKYLPMFERDKANISPSTAISIGIDNIRAKCPHFDQWLTKLENLQ